MLIERVNSSQSVVPGLEGYGLLRDDYGRKDMAYPERQVFAPFVVVVGGKYFFPVPECLLSGSGYFFAVFDFLLR